MNDIGTEEYLYRESLKWHAADSERMRKQQYRSYLYGQIFWGSILAFIALVMGWGVIDLVMGWL